MFLLDTDHLVILQLRTQPQADRLRKRMDEYSAEDFFVSIISFHEQVKGWNAYLNRATVPDAVVRAYYEFERILSEFARLRVASFDHDAADTFESLRRQRVRIGTMDLRIASTAVARNFQVLTRNTVDFVQVPGLRFDDWTVA